MFDFDGLKPVLDLWRKQIECAEKHKKSVFGNVAEQCWSFYDNAHEASELAGQSAESQAGLGLLAEMPETRFLVRIGKFAELVDLFGPHLYHKHPHRTHQERGRDLGLPEEEIAALFDPFGQFGYLAGRQQAKLRDRIATKLLGGFLNYTPLEFGLKHESRIGIDEALIKGRGLAWHELYASPTSGIVYPISTYRCVDDLLIDPDATSLRNAKWIALRCCESYYEVEREYGWPEGSLKEHARSGESHAQQASVDSAPSGGYRRKQGDTGDMLVYYKIFSKCGLGNHKAAPSISGIDEEAQALRTVLDGFGDYAFLVTAPGIPFALNLPPDLFDLDVSQPEVMEFFKDHVRWPLPFWADEGDHFGGWPFSPLDFHPLSNSVWPRAHMKAALAEMQFINHAFSFLTGRMEWSCRTIIAYAESLDSEIKEQVRTGRDLVTIKLKRSLYKNITDAVQFLQQPELNPEFWKILSAVMDQFDKRTGLVEYIYGSVSTQSRSATDAQHRQQAVTVRPDDMADKVEDWESHKARREAQMTRWKVPGATIGAILRDEPAEGDPTAGLMPQLWDELVAVPLDYANPETIDRVVREYEYTIESGSVRKPNKLREQENMDQALPVLTPMLQAHYQMTGDPTQLNALIADWAKSREIDPTPYLLPALPPPQPTAPAPAEGDPAAA